MECKQGAGFSPSHYHHHHLVGGGGEIVVGFLFFFKKKINRFIKTKTRIKFTTLKDHCFFIIIKLIKCCVCVLCVWPFTHLNIEY